MHPALVAPRLRGYAIAMPWTLYRYVLKELLKLLVMTSVVLVLVMSVAGAIKPLSDGLLGPLSLMKFVLFISPTMLSVALPFAGAFAGTLVFHRMTAENEILACRASGINYLVIMLPVVFLGIGLMVGMFYLSNWLIPSFYERAEHTLQKDVVSMVVRKVHQGEPIQHDKLILYADGAAEGEPPPMQKSRGIEPKRLVALTGVAVGRLDDEGRVKADGTAERADMLLYGANNESWIMLKLRNARYFGSDERGQRGVTEELTIGPYRVQSPFRERLQFLSLPELRKLKFEPEKYRHVRSAKERLIAALGGEQLSRAILKQVSPATGEGKVTLDSSIRGERYVIRSPKVSRTDVGIVLESEGDKPVEIDRFAHGVISERRFQARRAVLAIDPNTDGEPRIDIHLYDLKVVNTQESGRGTQHPTRVMPMMRWPEDIVRPLHETSIYTLLQVARRDYGDVENITEVVAVCEKQINRMMRKSMAQFHERVSLTVGTLLMIILGAVLSMKMAGRMALVVFFWGFVLAAISVIITYCGSKVLDDVGSTAGLVTLWSGNLIVLVAVMTTYWQLEKN